MARLPPLGYSTFYLQPSSGSRGSGGSACGSAAEPQLPGTVGSSNKGDRFVMLDSGLVSLEFDTQTGVRVLGGAGGGGTIGRARVLQARAARASALP